jgi:hypothetical protein
MSTPRFKKSIELINKNGALLVFPINNAKEPLSLWQLLHPRTPLKWEWDDDGDQKVFKMWTLMKELSNCRQVIYSKWYKGRATFFSRKLFTALLTVSQNLEIKNKESQILLEELKNNSPLSTKELKSITGLKGKLLEPSYNKAMKELFEKFKIVAYGEVDDGAFPSLAVGATENIYEELLIESQELEKTQALKIINASLKKDSLMFKFLIKTIEIS